MNPFKNIIISLQAAGTSAVVGIWLICMTAIALFAPVNDNTTTVVTALTIFGGFVGCGMTIRRD
jgi:hypothetical protein